MPNLVVPVPPADLVRVRAGAARRPRGPLRRRVGPRRFAGGVHLEAGSSASPTARPPRSRSATSNASSDAPRDGAGAFRYAPASMTLATDQQRRVRQPRSCGHDRARPRLGDSRPGRRPDLPVGRARGGQDPPGQGLRRRARRDRHDHLAELHPDGRVRRAVCRSSTSTSTASPTRPMRSPAGSSTTASRPGSRSIEWPDRLGRGAARRAARRRHRRVAATTRGRSRSGRTATDRDATSRSVP